MKEHQTIQSTVYRLVKPGVFKEENIQRKFQENHVIVTPYMASVCHADLRYFNGDRRLEALEKKLPMALFHEGIGRVNHSKHPSFKKGDRVVIVPNIPGYVLHQTKKEECCYVCLNEKYPNYCVNGVFLASGYDGISQSNLIINGENLVKIPDEIKDDIAILAELCSVSLYAINRIPNIKKTNGKIGVFGDGPVGYLTATALHYIYDIPKDDLIVFGANREKLQQFESFSHTRLVHDFDFSKEVGIHTIFECTGSQFSSTAINQAISIINREGTIVLMGVSEELVPINTRDVLEKGLHLIGSSRSTVHEFEQLMKAFQQENYLKALQKLIPSNHLEITSTEDLENAMYQVSEQKGWQKTYLSFKWS